MANPFQSQTGKAKAFRNRVTPISLAPFPQMPPGVMGNRPGDKEGWQQFAAGLDTWRRQVSQQITELFDKEDADATTNQIDTAVADVLASINTSLDAIRTSITALKALVTALTARVAALEAIESVVRYDHVQSVAIDQWTITHNKGKYPASIHLVDNSGTPFSGQAIEQTVNRVLISLGASYAGKASLLF